MAYNGQAVEQVQRIACRSSTEFCIETSFTLNEKAECTHLQLGLPRKFIKEALESTHFFSELGEGEKKTSAQQATLGTPSGNTEYGQNTSNTVGN